MAQNLLQLQSGSKSYGAQNLFQEATFSVDEFEHIGVIGNNGAGKSTLFKILIEEEHLDSGTVIRSKDLRLGYLSQHDHWNPGETGNEYLERTTLLPLWEVKAKGRDLQMPEDLLQKNIQSLSGGYRMRIKILSLLGQNPNLMLLDEPTNYLDLETTLLLETFLQNYDGAFLLISHDREFLRRTTDHTLELELGEITKFNGNIDDYFEQKELLRIQLESRAQTLAGKRQSILDFVNRFGAKATKARQAQSKLRSLEKMETIELKPLPTSAHIKIPIPTHVGKSVLRLHKADLGYENKKILSDVSLEILRGDHVAVVGLNGAGKSTLLKGLCATLPLQAGLREIGFGVKLGIYNQHVIEVLDPSLSVLESLQTKAHLEVGRQEILDMAGSLLFSSEQIHKKVKNLSGGEKSRVALGQLLLQKVPVLLLDEPTNHLDFQTVEALTQSLCKYEGTFVVVSHDRGFVRRVSQKILEISDGSVLVYPGSYDDYVWSLQRRLAAQEDLQVSSKTVAKSSPAEAPTIRLLKKETDKKVRALEKKIVECEARISILNAKNIELNDQIAKSVGYFPDLVTQYSVNATELEGLEAQWLQLSEELSNLQSN